MKGCRVLSFLATKKKTAPSGEEEGRMIPESSDSEMYFSMASSSRAERL